MITNSSTFLGVMSGSSLDGLDVAKVTFLSDPHGAYVNYEVDHFTTLSYPEEWKDKLKNYDQSTVREYLHMQSDYSYLVGDMINNCLKDWGIPNTDIKAIGLHGQTLIHLPEEGLTVQIGNGGTISAMTGIPTVCDVRTQDIARKGKGAPIVPIVDKEIYKGYKAYLNLGGIANISIPDAGIAYDICPLNQVFNHYALMEGKEYDSEGMLARNGKVDTAVYDVLAAQSYYKKSSPKTLDNNFIRNTYTPLLASLTSEDALATAVEVAAYEIAKCVGDCSPILVSGGGAFNTYLMERIQHFSASKCEYVIPSSTTVESKESVLMAYMAYLRLQKKPNIYKSYTGAESDTIAGALYE